MANARMMETLTDPRWEPHIFLATELLLLVVVAVVLFVFFPNL